MLGLQVRRIMNSALQMGPRAINSDKDVTGRRNHDRIAESVAKKGRVNREGADATPSSKTMTTTKFIATRQVRVPGIRTSPTRRRGHSKGPPDLIGVCTLDMVALSSCPRGDSN